MHSAEFAIGTISPGLKERAERGKVNEDRFDEYEATFFNMPQTWIRLLETCGRKFLILGQDEVLATNRSYVKQTRLPSGFVADGFRTSEIMAGRLGVTHRQYQRVRSAVSENFNNNLQNLLLIELLDNVWGFAGTTSGQPEFKDPALANVFLIGGKGQLWIPNLMAAHVRRIPALG